MSQSPIVFTAIKGFVASPSTIAVGNSVNFNGVLLRLDTNAGLPNQIISILESGQHVFSTITNIDGSFTGEIVFNIAGTYELTSQFAGTLVIPILSSSVYYRPFNLIYASGTKTIPESDSVIIGALQSFPLPPTMLTNVLLNVGNPSKYDSFLRSLQAITPNLFFALGDSRWNLNSLDILTAIRATLKAYRVYTNCLRIDHFDDLVANSGEAVVRSFLDEVRTDGYVHVMANPWVKAPSNMPWNVIDAAQIAVDSTTWQARTDRIQVILSQSPLGFTVVVNYENPPQQLALTSLGQQGSINALSIAADAQNTSIVPYRWMPPWSGNYDAFALQTIGWISSKLAQVDP